MNNGLLNETEKRWENDVQERPDRLDTSWKENCDFKR
jgi:hypothetical protein